MAPQLESVDVKAEDIMPNQLCQMGSLPFHERTSFDDYVFKKSEEVVTGSAHEGQSFVTG